MLRTYWTEGLREFYPSGLAVKVKSWCGPCWHKNDWIHFGGLHSEEPGTTQIDLNHTTNPRNLSSAIFATQRKKKKKACASHWHSQDILNDFRHQQHISVHPVVMWWLSELLRDFFFLFCFSFPENISSCSAEVLPAFLLLNSPPTQQSLFQDQPELLAARAREKEQWPGREKHWHYTFFPDIFFSSFLSSRSAT